MHLFKENAEQDRTHITRLIPIDAYCELLHTDAVDKVSAERCNRHNEGCHASHMRRDHLVRDAVISSAQLNRANIVQGYQLICLFIDSVRDTGIC